MDEGVARSRNLAARCREMAKFAANERLCKTLLGMAADYEQLAAEMAKKEADLEVNR